MRDIAHIQAQRNAARLRIIERLDTEGEGELAAKVRNCWQEIEFTCTGCEQRVIGHTRCKKKWCPVCAPSLAHRKNLRMTAAVAKFQWPLFITLTMKNVDDLNLGAVKQLRRSFGKLRHQKFWKKNVKGGVACIEVTNEGRGWHPHLHAVIDCRFLSITVREPNMNYSREEKKRSFQAAAEEVQQKWAKMLKQPIASIRIKRADRRTILKEVVKYAVKGTDLACCGDTIAPLVRAIEGTRLLTTFGTAFGIGKVKLPPEEIEVEYQDAEEIPEERIGHNCCGAPGLLPSSLYWQREIPRHGKPMAPLRLGAMLRAADRATCSKNDQRQRP